MHDRQRLLLLLKRFGWNATSFQSVEPEFRLWFDAAGTAAIAYLDTGPAWVVAGAPISNLERTLEVSSSFAAEARRRGKRVVFFAVEPRFLEAVPMPAIAIGSQPWWDPRDWTERHRGHRGLKEQLRRARAKGVATTRISSAVATGSMRRDLERLISRWQASRIMPPMTFLVALEPFALAEERRYYVALRESAAVGLLVAVPVYQRGGWFFEDILRDPSAPNGTTEQMIDAAMRDVAADGATFVTLGLVPLAGDARWMRIARTLGRGFYNFDGLAAFKAKLRPEGWAPIFAAWPEGRTPAGAVLDSLDAFAGGELIRFAARAALRAPSPVLFALGALLVPWTLALLASDTRRWFPSRRVQLAWVVFDSAMAASLISLSRRWRRRLAVATCGAAAADGVLTALQVARYNAPRSRNWRDAAVHMAAIAAPIAAAAILFGGLRARSCPTARDSAASQSRSDDLREGL